MINGRMLRCFTYVLGFLFSVYSFKSTIPENYKQSIFSKKHSVPERFEYSQEHYTERFPYGSVSRRDFKRRFRIVGLVEDHHIIPKQWRNHPVVNKYNYDIWRNNNLIMLPNKKGIQVLNTTRLLHSGGHIKYNIYVKVQLDRISNKTEFETFIKHLRKNMRTNEDNIDWN